jgi:hypothetical protein
MDAYTCIIQADVRNGYWAIDKAALLALLRNKVDEAPFLFRFFNKYYTRVNTLYGKHNTHFSTSTGIFQGDFHSPLLFCMAIDHAIVKANAVARDWAAMAYIDDNIIAVKAVWALEVLATLRGALAEAGLSLHPAKCRILTPRSDREILISQDILLPLIDDGITVLGTPVGSMEFRKAWSAEAVVDIKRALEAIKLLPSYQHR